ncbi:MAG TPA: hypothetical protein VLF94_09060 [Chlamydiales bacterium]|nr:hypothetical protein [Chlamydiales bacterium]
MFSHLAYTLIGWLVCAPLGAVTEFAVTYDFSGGRFGDCLLSYLHAKWLAYEKNIPLVYKSFPLSSQLVMHDKEKSFSDLGTGPRIRVYWGQPLNPHVKLPLFYICSYFPESRWELENTKQSEGRPWAPFQVNWKDPKFRQIVSEMIAPKKHLTLITPPKDHLSIAVHYRDGGDYDFSDKTTLWPLKFPPFDFYVDALRSAIAEARGKPIYCFLFTDAVDREALAKKFEEAIPIQFNYRKRNDRPESHVLEDFFSLFQFDILIRSESNFSLIPSLIHDFAIVYYPDEFVTVGNVTAITHIQKVTR